MARYRMDDGTIVDTEKSTRRWGEERDHDGHNFISRATGSQWEHQTLFRSRRGRYYIVHTSDWEGSMPHAEWVSPEEATRWLLLNEHELPEGLQKHEQTVSE
jgi:hypothetical protein